MAWSETKYSRLNDQVCGSEYCDGEEENRMDGFRNQEIIGGWGHSTGGLGQSDLSDTFGTKECGGLQSNCRLEDNQWWHRKQALQDGDSAKGVKVFEEGSICGKDRFGKWVPPCQDSRGQYRVLGNQVERKGIQVPSSAVWIEYRPRMFTKIVREMLQRWRGVYDILVFAFIDDFLVVGMNEKEVLRSLCIIMRDLGMLGWMTKKEKCILKPSQVIAFLGMKIDFIRGSKEERMVQLFENKQADGQFIDERFADVKVEKWLNFRAGELTNSAPYRRVNYGVWRSGSGVGFPGHLERLGQGVAHQPQGIGSCGENSVGYGREIEKSADPHICRQSGCFELPEERWRESPLFGSGG